MQKDDLMAIRNAVPEDRSFIFATFLRGMYYGDSWFSQIPKNIFMKEYHRVIEAILTIPGVEIKVACLKEDPNTVLGYSITGAKGTKLHYVFVKKVWRGIGIARSLVPTTITNVTHLTSVGLDLLRKNPNVIFNPFDLT